MTAASRKGTHPPRDAAGTGSGEEGAREASLESGRFSISSEPFATSGETAVVRQGLYRFNFDATGLTRHHDVTFFVRDPAGSIRGGLLGYVWAEWLHITEFWLAEDCRRQGLGGQLLQKAESFATLVGARGAFLSTFDFQAPEFYVRHGYEIYATLKDNPPGHAEHHLRKVFRS